MLESSCRVIRREASQYLAKDSRCSITHYNDQLFSTIPAPESKYPISSSLIDFSLVFSRRVFRRLFAYLFISHERQMRLLIVSSDCFYWSEGEKFTCQLSCGRTHTSQELTGFYTDFFPKQTLLFHYQTARNASDYLMSNQHNLV